MGKNQHVGLKEVREPYPVMSEKIANLNNEI